MREEGPAPRLLSVNVGLPPDVAWQGRTVRTSVWKAPVTGHRLVRRLDVDGDAYGDLQAHGGEHQAVLVYQFERIRTGNESSAAGALDIGQFGENFTVEGVADDEVYIGDRYRIVCAGAGIYNGYGYWGRPTMHELHVDLRALLHRAVESKSACQWILPAFVPPPKTNALGAKRT